MKEFLYRFYRYIRLRLKYYGGVAGLIVYSIPAFFADKKGRNIVKRITTMQIFFTGNWALGIITTISLLIGVITVLQLFTYLSKFGALEYVGKILNVVIIRELGPLLTAIVVIARSGTAIASEIASMMVNGEVDAIEMIGIDPLKMIVFPRIVGVSTALLFLTIYFDALGLIGGFIVGNIIAGINFQAFMSYIIAYIGIGDICLGLVKAIVFGVFISAISVYHGFQAFDPTNIPQVTTKAVVDSLATVIILDVLITIVFYLR